MCLSCIDEMEGREAKEFPVDEEEEKDIIEAEESRESVVGVEDVKRMDGAADRAFIDVLSFIKRPPHPPPVKHKKKKHHPKPQAINTPGLSLPIIPHTPTCIPDVSDIQYGGFEPAPSTIAPSHDGDSYGSPQADPVSAPDSYGSPQAPPVSAPDSYEIGRAHV